MIVNDKRYNNINFELKKHFSQKIIKLSLDGGFTCPTRDGKLDTRGCIFCSKKGSGEFTNFHTDIQIQIDEQIKLLSNKWQNCKYIAYFQNFTNTYKNADELTKLYNFALTNPDVVGLSVATRADCLGDDVLKVLDYFNKHTYLFVELGLQSIHEDTANFIRRGYNLNTFENALTKLNELNIKTVVHTIVGLPTEDKNKIMQTYKYLNKKDIWGIKISQLNILKDTDLEIYYRKNPFYIMNADEYISFICDIIENLRDDIVIHRLTGDGAKDELIAPKWILNKRYVLNGIDKELKKRDTRQGDLYFL
ncbi:TIGR01212 family radical SAM protein [Peptoanaerobacter stomatis]|uniref:TIGR01212 family radical SAM protein n=1 Tax=Peptoanaerobacter stomatis TaxID=796937 RepID=UPI003FA11E8A